MAAARVGEFGRELVLAISSLCAAILHRQGAAWAAKFITGPPPQPLHLFT